MPAIVFLSGFKGGLDRKDLTWSPDWGRGHDKYNFEFLHRLFYNPFGET